VRVVFGLDPRHVARRDVIALDPGAEVPGIIGHVVLALAGLDAPAAADALLDVDEHRPPVARDVVVGRILRAPGGDEGPGLAGGAGQQQEPRGIGEESAAVELHGLLLHSIPGACAT